MEEVDKLNFDQCCMIVMILRRIFLAAGLLKTMNEMKKKLSNQKGEVVVIQKVQTCLTNLFFI